MAKAIRRSWKGGSRSEPPLYEPSLDDKWCNETRTRVALAIGKWLIEANVTHRAINSLQRWELEAMADTAMNEYTDARCERYEAETAIEANTSDSPIPSLVG